jgi:hypothetical protein
VDLVREFLEHFQLHSTLAVFLPEACLEGDYPGRAQLAQRLGIADESGLPLLMSMMKRGGGGGQAGASGRPATLSPGTPSPVERNAGAGGSPQVRKPAAGDANNKFAFGSGADSKGGLGSLADMPALPGAGKKSSASSTESDGMSERVRKLQSLAKEGSERRSPQDENESDESLTRYLLLPPPGLSNRATRSVAKLCNPQHAGYRPIVLLACPLAANAPQSSHLLATRPVRAPVSCACFVRRSSSSCLVHAPPRWQYNTTSIHQQSGRARQDVAEGWQQPLAVVQGRSLSTKCPQPCQQQEWQ